MHNSIPASFRQRQLLAFIQGVQVKASRLGFFGSVGVGEISVVLGIGDWGLGRRFALCEKGRWEDEGCTPVYAYLQINC